MTREQFRQVKEITRWHVDYAQCFDGFRSVGSDNYNKIKVFEEDGYCWTVGFSVGWWDSEPEFSVMILDFKKGDDGEMHLISEGYLDMDFEEDEDGHEVAFYNGINLEEVIGWVRN